MNHDRFIAEVLEADGPVLVDFSATWCPPCRMMDGVVDAVAEARPQLRVLKINVDEATDSAARYGVLSLPTLMLFRDGAPVLTLTGARPRHRLERELDAVL